MQRLLGGGGCGWCVVRWHCADFSLVNTFRCQKDFLRRATPFDTGVLGCQKVSLAGVSKGVEGVGGNFRVSPKKIDSDILCEVTIY